MSRSPLTATVNRVQQMIDYVRENLDDEEYDLFLDLILPEPEPQVEKPKPRKPKRILHCDACDYTKRHQVHKDEQRSDYHEFQLKSSIPRCTQCGLAKESITHRHKDLADYHEFQSTKGTAKSARTKSLQQQIQTVRPLDGGVSKMRCAKEGCGEYGDNNIHHRTTDPDYHEFVAGDSGKSHALAAGEGL